MAFVFTSEDFESAAKKAGYFTKEQHAKHLAKVAADFEVALKEGYFSKVDPGHPHGYFSKVEDPGHTHNVCAAQDCAKQATANPAMPQGLQRVGKALAREQAEARRMMQEEAACVKVPVQVEPEPAPNNTPKGLLMVSDTPFRMGSARWQADR